MQVNLELRDLETVAEIKNIYYDLEGDIVDYKATIKVKLSEVMEQRAQHERDCGEFARMLTVKGCVIKEYEGIPYRIGVEDNLESFEVDKDGYIYLEIFYFEFA